LWPGGSSSKDFSMLDSNLDMCKAIDIDLINDTSNGTKLQILLSLTYYVVGVALRSH